MLYGNTKIRAPERRRRKPGFEGANVLEGVLAHAVRSASHTTGTRNLAPLMQGVKLHICTSYPHPLASEIVKPRTRIFGSPNMRLDPAIRVTFDDMSKNQRLRASHLAKLE